MPCLLICWRGGVLHQFLGRVLIPCLCSLPDREDEMLLTDFISVKNHFSFSIYIFDGNFHAPLVHRLGDASAYR